MQADSFADSNLSWGFNEEGASKNKCLLAHFYNQNVYFVKMFEGDIFSKNFHKKSLPVQKQAQRGRKHIFFMKQFPSMKMLKRFLFKECIIRHVQKFLQTLEAQIISVFLCSHLLLLPTSHFSLTFFSVSNSNILSLFPFTTSGLLYFFSFKSVHMYLTCTVSHSLPCSTPTLFLRVCLPFTWMQSLLALFSFNLFRWRHHFLPQT